MDTPSHRLPDQGIAQEPTTDAAVPKDRFDENNGDPITTDADLSLEQREQLEEDQRHNRDLEYPQGGDTSDENGDPIDAAQNERVGSDTVRFARSADDLEDANLERERLKASSSP
jgi:hypothetical protein